MTVGGVRLDAPNLGDHFESLTIQAQGAGRG